jgi:hypothetical protein
MKTEQILEDYGFRIGCMISGSKSGYYDKYPDNVVYFNANIITEDGKIWWGDIDVTKSEDVLKKVAKEANKDLFILSEMDARFENENDSVSKLKSKARVIFDKDGKTVWYKPSAY